MVFDLVDAINGVVVLIEHLTLVLLVGYLVSMLVTSQVTLAALRSLFD